MTLGAPRKATSTWTSAIVERAVADAIRRYPSRSLAIADTEYCSPLIPQRGNRDALLEHAVRQAEEAPRQALQSLQEAELQPGTPGSSITIALVRATALLRLAQTGPALDLLNSLGPPDALSSEEASWAWCLRGRVAEASGHQERALSCYERSIGIGGRTSAHSAGLAARIFRADDQNLEALAKVDVALELAARNGQNDWIVEMLFLKTQVLSTLGRRHDAEVCLFEADRWITRGGLEKDAASYLNARAAAETAVGRLQPGLSTAVEALRSSNGAAAAAFAAATAAWNSGQLAVAVHGYEASARAAHIEGNKSAQANAYVHAAAVLQQAQQWDDALVYLTRAQKLVEDSAPLHKERTLRELRLEMRWVRAQSLDPRKALIWLRDDFANPELPPGKSVEYKLRLGRICLEAEKQREAAHWFSLASIQANQAGLHLTAEFASGLEAIYLHYPETGWAALLGSIYELRAAGDDARADNLLMSAMGTQVNVRAPMPPEIIEQGAARAMLALLDAGQFINPAARAAHRSGTRTLDPYSVALEGADQGGRSGTVADLVDFVICAYSHTHDLLTARSPGIFVSFETENGTVRVGPQGEAPAQPAVLNTSSLPVRSPPPLIKTVLKRPLCLQRGYEGLASRFPSVQRAVRLW